MTPAGRHWWRHSGPRILAGCLIGFGVVVLVLSQAGLFAVPGVGVNIAVACSLAGAVLLILFGLGSSPGRW